MPRKWTAEEDAMLRTLPINEVSARTGRTIGAVWHRRNRLAIPTKRHKLGDRYIAPYKLFQTIGEIARLFDVSPQSVHCALKVRGLTK